MPTIWSYGYINLDIITQTVSHWPPHSELVWVDRIDLKPGGVALNPALAIAILGGVPAGLIGYIGADAAGRLLKEEIERLGLNTSRLVIDPAQPTGICIVGVHPDTERSFLISGGANRRLGRETFSLTGLSPGDFFHVGGAMSITDLATRLGQVRNQGLHISVDVAFDKAGDWWPRLAPLLPLTDIFMANAFESEQLTGSPDPARSAQILAGAGADLVIIKLGAAGCYLFNQSWRGLIPSFSVAAVDTTGAGDSFAGAFVYGLAKGWRAEQAATLANAVGALSTTMAGATTGLRAYPETIAFIREQGRAGAWQWD
jgi:ribokinase